MATSNGLGLGFLFTTYMCFQCYFYFPAKHTGLIRGKDTIQYAATESEARRLYRKKRPPGSPKAKGIFGPDIDGGEKVLRLERILIGWNYARCCSYFDRTNLAELQANGIAPLNDFAYWKFYDFGYDMGTLPKRVYEAESTMYDDQVIGIGELSYSAQVWAGEEYDTTAYIYELRDRVVIAFQGSKNYTHFQTDMMAGQEDLDIMGASRTGRKNFYEVENPFGEEWVHQGFHQAYIQMHANIVQWLDMPEHRDLPVMCTGHSMGAGLATMCCRYLGEIPRYDPTMLCLTTFGSPRVGNVAFRDAIQAKVGECWRCVCENDVVPSLPYEDMSSCAQILKVLCSCCAWCWVPKQALDNLTQQHGMYTHIGNVVQLALDGMLATDPCFVDDQYMRQMLVQAGRAVGDLFVSVRRLAKRRHPLL